MAETRRLYRSRTNRKLAGVCGGLSEYFNTDATLIRVLFVVITVPTRRLARAAQPAEATHRAAGQTGSSGAQAAGTPAIGPPAI
jgi:PspC domain